MIRLIAKEIDGVWIIEKPDGSRIEPREFVGTFRSRNIAEAVIEYLEIRKPTAPSIPEARIESRNAHDNATLRKLADDRRRRTKEHRVAILKSIAERRGLTWATETGFCER